MSQGFQKPGFGVWPPGMPAFQKTDSTLTLYLDPVGGDDDKVGTSRANAVRTPARIADLIPLYCGNVDVHMRSGAAVLPARGWFLASRLLNGLIRFIADEAWDADVFTVIGGDRVAAAATSGVVVKSSGLVVNALRGSSMRFVDGDAAGQYRRVRNNTATDITPTRVFDPAPAPGDTYQIFTSNARFALPDEGGQENEYRFLDDCLGTPGTPDVQVYFADLARPVGLLFDGVGLEGGQGVYAYHFGRAPVFFFGTDATENFLTADYAVTGTGTYIFSGFGQLPDYALKLGWGFASAAAPYMAEGQITGCMCVGIVFVSCPCTFYGGRYGYVYHYGEGHIAHFWGDELDVVNALIDEAFTLTGNVVTMSGLGVIDLYAVDLPTTGAIKVEYGGYIWLYESTSGPAPVDARNNGFVLCYSTVNVGGAGNDWTMRGIAAFNKSFFSGPGTIKIGSDMSMCMRT